MYRYNKHTSWYEYYHYISVLTISPVEAGREDEKTPVPLALSLCIAATADFPHVTSDVTVAGSELCNIDNEKCLHDNQTPVQAANKLSIDKSQVESESHDEIT